jgi:DNA primase
MKTRSIDFDQINRAALASFAAVLARVLPSGKQVHREWVALNPRRADRRLGSFKVNRYNGRWADFATGDKGGDPISLVAYIEGVSQSEAARRLARMLGIDCGGRE